MASCQLDSNCHMGRSRHSIQLSAAGEEALESAMQDTWLSTPALLALLADWTHSRRAHSTRFLCAAVGILFVESVLLLTEVQPFAVKPPVCVRNCCHLGTLEAGVCG